MNRDAGDELVRFLLRPLGIVWWACAEVFLQVTRLPRHVAATAIAALMVAAVVVPASGPIETAVRAVAVAPLAALIVLVAWALYQNPRLLDRDGDYPPSPAAVPIGLGFGGAQYLAAAVFSADVINGWPIEFGWAAPFLFGVGLVIAVPPRCGSRRRVFSLLAPTA